MAADDLPGALQGLNPAQREAVESQAAPLCILAGAGSGKTRVLTRRVAWRIRDGTADPRHVLVVTFTRKAAGELAGRLGALGVRDQVASGTFHALAYAQLRRRWADRSERPPALLERKVRLLAPLLPRGRNATVQPIDVATEIEWAKAQMIGPERYEHAASRAGRTPPLPSGAIVSIYERYEQEKRRRGLVDFDDLLLLCARALETDREFAAGQRWRFRHLFVDEFQDVNPAQFRLLQGWRGDRDDLCVVGDPNQGIFSWNGADVGFLTSFAQHFPGATVLRLDDNYRSSPEILAVANAVLGRHAGLRANRPSGAVPTVSSHSSDRDEAQAVARALRSRHSPAVPWAHQAVLTRTNAQLVLFEEALHAAQVPYRVKGRGAFLDQPEVRQALIELRRLPAGTPLLSAITDIDELLVDDGADERHLQLEALVRLAREHAASDPAATIGTFNAWLVATVRGDQPEQAGDAVTLATFHAAKGLEWPVVFLAGLERGLVPIGHADSAEERDEERRLFYVAVTRAERELHCSWAERRTFGSRARTRAPSPWLEAVDATLRALAQGSDGTDWRRHVHAGRATLKRAGTRAGPRAHLDVGAHADPAVYQALKTWRSATARASGVPAFVIFHDTTLAAVAEAKPRDRTSLLALPGMGPVKADRYGEALLAVVAEHVPGLRVRFSVEHRFAAPLADVERAMTDPAFFAELRDVPGIEEPALLGRRERPGSVELEVRYVFSGDLPSVARRVLGRGELAWVQRSIVDLERHRTEFTIVPETHADLLTCRGTYLLGRLSPSAPGDSGEHTARTISGELRVRVPLLAGRAERAITAGLVDRIGAEAAALQRWLTFATRRMRHPNR